MPFYASPTVENSDRISRLLGGRFHKRDRILFTTKNDTLSRENAYFNKSEKNDFNGNLCSQKLVLYSENILLGKRVVSFLLSKGLLGKLRPGQFKSCLV